MIRLILLTSLFCTAQLIYGNEKVVLDELLKKSNNVPGLFLLTDVNNCRPCTNKTLKDSRVHNKPILLVTPEYSKEVLGKIKSQMLDTSFFELFSNSNLYESLIKLGYADNLVSYNKNGFKIIDNDVLFVKTASANANIEYSPSFYNKSQFASVDSFEINPKWGIKNVLSTVAEEKNGRVFFVGNKFTNMIYKSEYDDASKSKAIQIKDAIQLKRKYIYLNAYYYHRDIFKRTWGFIDTARNFKYKNDHNLEAIACHNNKLYAFVTMGIFMKNGNSIRTYSTTCVFIYSFEGKLQNYFVAPLRIAKAGHTMVPNFFDATFIDVISDSTVYTGVQNLNTQGFRSKELQDKHAYSAYWSLKRNKISLIEPINIVLPENLRHKYEPSLLVNCKTFVRGNEKNKIHQLLPYIFDSKNEVNYKLPLALNFYSDSMPYEEQVKMHSFKLEWIEEHSGTYYLAISQYDKVFFYTSNDLVNYKVIKSLYLPSRSYFNLVSYNPKSLKYIYQPLGSSSQAKLYRFSYIN